MSWLSCLRWKDILLAPCQNDSVLQEWCFTSRVLCPSGSRAVISMYLQCQLCHLNGDPWTQPHSAQRKDAVAASTPCFKPGSLSVSWGPGWRFGCRLAFSYGLSMSWHTQLLPVVLLQGDVLWLWWPFSKELCSGCLSAVWMLMATAQASLPTHCSGWLQLVGHFQ